jgi:hypothetical protein
MPKASTRDQKSSAGLDLVHVIRPATYNLSGPDVMGQAHDLAEREIRSFVSSLQRNRALEGIENRSWVLDSDVAEICRIVRSPGTDLVWWARMAVASYAN